MPEPLISSSPEATQVSDGTASDHALGITVYALPLQQDTLDPGQRRRGRWKMVLLLLVCVLPLLASYFTYYVVRPQARSNYGQLIAPQRPLPNAVVSAVAGTKNAANAVHNLRELKGQWILLSASSAGCDSDCEHNLYLQRQLREALGREKGRVDWVWLVDDDNPVRAALRPALEQAMVLRVNPQVLRTWLPAGDSGRYSSLYVVDPMGNLMMYFAPGFAFKKTLKDLERLLRASASWDTAGRLSPKAQ